MAIYSALEFTMLTLTTELLPKNNLHHSVFVFVVLLYICYPTYAQLLHIMWVHTCTQKFSDENPCN